MVTKTEMENIWKSGPIDWLKDLGKKNKKGKKKLKPFTVTVTPYTKNYLEPVSLKVWAKNYEQAREERCYDQLKAKYPEHFEKSPYSDHHWPKEGFVTETKVTEGH